jgi:hypothetical protein
VLRGALDDAYMALREIPTRDSRECSRRQDGCAWITVYINSVIRFSHRRILHNLIIARWVFRASASTPLVPNCILFASHRSYEECLTCFRDYPVNVIEEQFDTQIDITGCRNSKASARLATRALIQHHFSMIAILHASGRALLTDQKGERFAGRLQRLPVNFGSGMPMADSAPLPVPGGLRSLAEVERNSLVALRVLGHIGKRSELEQLALAAPESRGMRDP